MNQRSHHGRRQVAPLLGLAALSLLFSGCATQQTLRQYQDEVRALREERTRLKKENRRLLGEIDNYQIALSEANAPIQEIPEVGDYQNLTDLGVGVEQRGRDFVMILPSSITFASGRADLTKQGKTALQEVARTLAADYSNGFDYWIEGHTDTDPIKKSKWGSNRELSVARAVAVLRFLVEECGVQDDDCVVAGHGQYAPIDANDTRDGKARNRRVEIVVHPVGG